MKNKSKYFEIFYSFQKKKKYFKWNQRITERIDIIKGFSRFSVRKYLRIVISNLLSV